MISIASPCSKMPSPSRRTISESSSFGFKKGSISGHHLLTISNSFTVSISTIITLSYSNSKMVSHSARIGKAHGSVKLKGTSCYTTYLGAVHRYYTTMFRIVNRTSVSTSAERAHNSNRFHNINKGVRIRFLDNSFDFNEFVASSHCH